MLTLPIQKKWYDMILSGEKKRRVSGNKRILRNKIPESVWSNNYISIKFLFR